MPLVLVRHRQDTYAGTVDPFAGSTHLLLGERGLCVGLRTIRGGAVNGMTLVRCGLTQLGVGPEPSPTSARPSSPERGGRRWWWWANI